MKIRLTTYNVRGFPWCHTDIHAIVHWITRRSGAEIVALQEVWCRHRAWAAAFAAAGWTFARPPREHHTMGLFGSGLAIAWRRESWTLEDARFYPYVSAIGLDMFVVKGWFRVEIRSPQTGFCLRLINTHMQSDYEVCDDLWRPIAEPVRMGQAFQLTDVESALPPLPTLIVGDMNTEMCWFSGCGWLTQHAGVTFPNTNQRLDHCAAPLSQPWVIHRHRVARECGTLSDHWPVSWLLEWAPTIPSQALPPRPEHHGSPPLPPMTTHPPHEGPPRQPVGQDLATQPAPH